MDTTSTYKLPVPLRKVLLPQMSHALTHVLWRTHPTVGKKPTKKLIFLDYSHSKLTPPAWKAAIYTLPLACGIWQTWICSHTACTAYNNPLHTVTRSPQSTPHLQLLCLTVTVHLYHLGNAASPRLQNHTTFLFHFSRLLISTNPPSLRYQFLLAQMWQSTATEECQECNRLTLPPCWQSFSITFHWWGKFRHQGLAGTHMRLHWAAVHWQTCCYEYEIHY